MQDIKKEKQQLENDEELLMNRVIEEHEDLKSRMGASRPDLRRRISGRKRNHDESEYTETYSQSYSQTQTNDHSEMNTAYSDTETEHTEDTVKERSDSESVSDASTIINNTLAKRAPTQASVMASQALTNVTALSKKSLNHMEPDSVLGASTAHGTLKGRAKMDAMNKSHRSGLYSTIGRNAKMPEEDEDEEEESKHERSRRSQKPGKNSFPVIRTQKLDFGRS